jgi:hypothetical protein
MLFSDAQTRELFLIRLLRLATNFRRNGSSNYNSIHYIL